MKYPVKYPKHIGWFTESWDHYGTEQLVPHYRETHVDNAQGAAIIQLWVDCMKGWARFSSMRVER